MCKIFSNKNGKNILSFFNQNIIFLLSSIWFSQLIRSEVGTFTHIYLQPMTFPTSSVSGLICDYLKEITNMNNDIYVF